VSGARPLRVAVVGVGHLGRIHARIYAESPLSELVCVVDTDGSRAEELGRELGCPGHSDPARIPDDVEAVRIVVPTVHHADVAVPLLERGIPCLVEKPLAGDLFSADRILRAAELGGAALAVGHVERFQPGLRKVRELGLRPRFIECHRLATFSFRSMDVGVVHDLMIHDLDLVLDLVASEVEELDASGGSILTESEDLASVHLVFKNGVRANVTASRVSLSPMRRFRMFSSESYVSLDFTKNYGLIVRKGPGWDAGREDLKRLSPAELAARKDFVNGDMLVVDELDLGGDRPLQAELASFLAAVREGRPPEVTGEDGRRALALADRIRGEIAGQVW
jgi:predicted dehydrogenase